MTLQTGSNDPATLDRLTGAEVIAEAVRLENNLRETGMEYTAAVIRRLCEMLEAE